VSPALIVGNSDAALRLETASDQPFVTAIEAVWTAVTGDPNDLHSPVQCRAGTHLAIGLAATHIDHRMHHLHQSGPLWAYLAELWSITLELAPPLLLSLLLAGLAHIWLP
jgi:hypothetical protein